MLTYPLFIIGVAVLLGLWVHRVLIDRGVLSRPSRAQAKTIRAIHRSGLVSSAIFMLVGAVLGFLNSTDDAPNPVAVSTHRSASDSLASVDPEVVVQRLEIEHPQRLASLQDQYGAEHGIWRRHVKAAVSTMIDLRKRGAGPAGTDLALVALMQGVTHEASAILQVVAESRGTAESYRQLGALTFLDEPAKSLAAYRRAAELDPADPDCVHQLGYLAMEIPDLDEAERAYRKLYEIGKARQDRVWLALAFSNMGNVYLSRGVLDEAERMYRQALKYAQEIGNQRDVASQYSNLANLDVNRGSWESAEASYRRALQIHIALGSMPDQGTDYTNLGNVYYNREDFQQAESMFRKALQIFQSLGDQEAVASNYTNLGNVYYHRGDEPTAASLFAQAQQIYRSLAPRSASSAFGEHGVATIAASRRL